MAQVWHFSDAGVAQSVQEAEVGRFSTDQAYVVLAPAAEGSDGQQRLFLWAGSDAPQETKSTAAKHAGELMKTLEASYLRQQQGHESAEFKQLFASFTIVEAAPSAAGGASGEEEEGEGEEEQQADGEASNEGGAAGAAGGKKKKKKNKKKNGGQQQQQEGSSNGGEAQEAMEAVAEAEVPAAAAAAAAPASPATAAQAASPAKEEAKQPSPKASPAKQAPASPAAPAAASPAPTPAAEEAVAAASAESSPPAESTPPAKTPSEEVSSESVAKAKQQLMSKLSGSLSDPLTQRQQQKDGGSAGNSGRKSSASYAADAAKAWGGVATEAVAAAPCPVDVKIKPGEQTFGYEELKAMRVESGIDMTAKEAYLSDAEFEKVFGKDRAAFKAQPAWRQQMAKKQAGLW